MDRSLVAYFISHISDSLKPLNTTSVCRHAAMTTLFKLTSYVSRKSFLPDRIGLKFL